MTRITSLPAARAPLANGVPIQPLTGLPLQPEERVLLRAHPLTGAPLLDGEEPTVEERMSALGNGGYQRHPVMPHLLDANPVDVAMVLLVSGLYEREPFDWTKHPLTGAPVAGTYDALESDPYLIAEDAYFRAQAAIATCPHELPEQVWVALMKHGSVLSLHALLQNQNCPEEIRVQVALRLN